MRLERGELYLFIFILTSFFLENLAQPTRPCKADRPPYYARSSLSSGKRRAGNHTKAKPLLLPDSLLNTPQEACLFRNEAEVMAAPFRPDDLADLAIAHSPVGDRQRKRFPPAHLQRTPLRMRRR